jgi:hypothetical protein
MSSRCLPVAGRAFVVLAAVTFLGGCVNVGSWSFGSFSSSSGTTVSGRNVRLAAFSPEQSDLASRQLETSFAPGEPVRIFNIAGRVELETAAVDAVQVTATVYADAGDAEQTQRLLDSIEWTSFAGGGEETWHRLTVPPLGSRAVHYPGLRQGEITYESTRSGMRAAVHAQPGLGVPTMFADLRIVCPPSADVSITTVLGDIVAGELAGAVTIDTAWGDVTVDACTGTLTVDTGCGEVVVGHVDGHLHADTGSGDVRVERLTGDAFADTGSGTIAVRTAEGGALRADTGSGDVIVHDGRLASITVDTGSGDITLHDVEFEVLVADTGTGEIRVGGSLLDARSIVADTGSGDVTIEAGPDASFSLVVDQGAGRTVIGFDDAELRWSDRDLVGAVRGDGRTRIQVDTGTGDCVIRPR